MCLSGDVSVSVRCRILLLLQLGHIEIKLLSNKLEHLENRYTLKCYVINVFLRTLLHVFIDNQLSRNIIFASLLGTGAT